MYKYIEENKGKIWHLCNGCNYNPGDCEGSPIFMCNLHEVPPPDNDAVIICESFVKKKTKFPEHGKNYSFDMSQAEILRKRNKELADSNSHDYGLEEVYPDEE